ncbi:MAG: hydroxymethylbilane synthase [Desulfobacterales bacterium]
MAAKLIIGTRGSKLALWQANWVKQALESLHPDLSCKLSVIKTQGDKILDVPLAKVGGKGLFVKEIEEALLRGDIDLAVHSMKDMPAALPEGLTIGAIPRRETPNDVLISKNDLHLDALPQGAVIGTSSLRRAAQLRNARPDLTIRSLRGNVPTRLRKLQEENLDAIVLAAAGVKRMGLADHISQELPSDVMLPAVGQGALCIETRAEDPQVTPRIAALEHEETRIAVTAERAFLKRLEGGCQVPIAALAVVSGKLIHLASLVADLNGTRLIRSFRKGWKDSAVQLGVDAAEELLFRGAAGILDELKE